MSMGKECETGCGVFEGDDIMHHRDCVHYPNSVAKMLDDTKASNAALREELAALRAHNAVIRDKANCALSDLSGLLSYQKINLDDGSYRFDGQAAFELGYAIQETPSQSLAKVRADAIRSIMDTEYSCETPNGDIAWSSRAIEEHASQIEAGL